MDLILEVVMFNNTSTLQIYDGVLVLNVIDNLAKKTGAPTTIISQENLKKSSGSCASSHKKLFRKICYRGRIFDPSL